VRRTVLSALALLFLHTGQGIAQQVRQDSMARADSVRRVSPGSAFFRSLIIPGWGQVSAGAYVRAGTFVALQGASGYMLVKTLRRLSDAEKAEPLRVAAAGDSIRGAAVTPDDSVRVNDPERLRAAIDSVVAVRRIRGLIESRKEQREDWITYTIALTLASGIDAFVAAHLSQLPATISATPRRGGGANLNIRMPIGPRP
jgi:uncharacterized protein DUF5683